MMIGKSYFERGPDLERETDREIRRIVSSAAELPAITGAAALFLDLDGTLADIMPTPEEVRVGLTELAALASLQQSLNGALAIVTGRAINDVDGILDPLRLTAAGMHGAEFRFGDSAIVPRAGLAINAPQLIRDVTEVLRPFIAHHAGVRLEEKRLALSLHYRAAPEHAELCWQAAVSAVRGAPGFEVRPGKMLVEIVETATNKGAAVREIMTAPPFAGRIPIFAGDDTADEAAIQAVQELGGFGIRVVEDPLTPTSARYRVLAASVVRDWLTMQSV